MLNVIIYNIIYNINILRNGDRHQNVALDKAVIERLVEENTRLMEEIGRLVGENMCTRLMEENGILVEENSMLAAENSRMR